MANSLGNLNQAVLAEVDATRQIYARSSKQVLKLEEYTQDLQSQNEVLRSVNDEINVSALQGRAEIQKQKEGIAHTSETLQEMVELINQSNEQTNKIAGLLIKLMAIAEQL